jgi:hypothetical protein
MVAPEAAEPVNKERNCIAFWTSTPGELLT